MLVHPLWIDAKLVDVPFTWHLLDDVFVIVVAERAAELVITHVLFVLVFSPPGSYCFWL